IVKNAKASSETLIAAGNRIVSGGKDNHLLLLDVTPLGLTGNIAEGVLDQVGITTNKNTIPYDTEIPFVTSRVQIGTTAVTDRRCKEEEMKEIARMKQLTLKNHDDPKTLNKAAESVQALTKQFPLYE